MHLFSPIPVLLFNAILVVGCRFDPESVKTLGKPPDRFLNVSELIEYHGYKGKDYEAVTEDGYIISLTRLGEQSGPPVLFVHGLSISPELWVMRGPGHDLPYVLSDLGYDVWIGTQRGIYGSLKHTKLSTSQPEFWDFSHDETGTYDLPAMIDVIRKESGHSKVFYVGNSLGGAFLMAMCSTRPDYCSSVAGNAQYVPAMYVPSWDEYSSHSKFLLYCLHMLLKLLKATGQHKLLVHSSLYMKFGNNVCGSEIGRVFCGSVLKFLTEFDFNHIPKGWAGYMLAYSQGGTSVRQVEHLLQLAMKGGTWMFDFGEAENMVKYGSPTPPSYNLSMLTSPTLVFYSKVDTLITLPAMKKTLTMLGNLKIARIPPDPSYGHLDFDFGKNLHRLVYPDIVDFFDSISGLN